MKKTQYKTMFGLIKKIFIELLTGLVNGSNHANHSHAYHSAIRNV